MWKFIKFAVLGGGGLLVNLGVTYLLTQYAHLWYFLSFIVGTFTSWSILFIAHSFITFVGHSKEAYLRRYALFISGYLGIFCVNAVCVYLLTSVLHIYYLVSIIAVTCLSTFATFFFSKRYVYQD
jgi:putative flippase GtrA